MSTRYSLPRDAENSDAARAARIVAALTLVLTVLALSLVAAVLPPAEPAMAALPEPEPVATPTAVGA